MDGSSVELSPRKNSKLVIYLLGAVLPVGALLLWQVFGQLGYISTMLFPTPATIFGAFIQLTTSGLLMEHFQISVTRMVIGFLIGGGLGLLFGIVVGLSKPVEKALDPTVQMIRMIPHLAVAPLFILWLGIGEESKVLLIAKGAFFPLYINTYLGIRSVDNKLFEVARTLGFNRWKLVRLLVIPSAVPNLLLGLRLSLGVSWVGLVVAELMAATSGIGYLMSDARQFNNTPVVFVGIAIFAVVGVFTDTVVRLLEKWLLRWKDSYQG
ncbi:ABC transporter permease [Robertmurraya kyonggiensis]|uniref:ABC transporter permease n=1 Tax=Robertmurraya kyonggiensis TaxID=1037680 RepID=A0A4V5P0J8_9BACI|nr:ABC transporter permease [Robertmurraya kyonggiensis]TKC14720.1 ABC transporter permease [Robertmurraya kyonggiensis]